MRRERITYTGAYHYVMNRGYDDNDIFVGIIKNDAYLIKAIEYLLQNPVRAGIVTSAEAYTWSSINYYYSDQKTGIVDADFVNQLFGSKEGLLTDLDGVGVKQLPVTKTKHGEVLGSVSFLERTLKKFNRRQKPTDQSHGVHRNDERYFEPVEKVLWEFKNIHGIELEEIDTTTRAGKCLRGELLVLLKDKAGLKYKDICDISVFSDLSFTSLPVLYRRTKKN